MASLKWLLVLGAGLAFGFAEAANSTDSADKDLSSDTTINVASGDTLTWSGAVSGSGKLTKTGDGTLIFAHDNSSTFSGEIAVQGGAIQLNTAGGFGTGAITVTVPAEANKQRGVILNAADATVANNMTFTCSNISQEGYYVMYFLKSATLTGTITAKDNFCVGGDAGYTLKFAGNINAKGKNVIFAHKGRVDIPESCTITASIIMSYTSSSFDQASLHFYGDGSRHTVSDSFGMKQLPIYCENKDSLPYALYYVTCANAGYSASSMAFNIDLQGYDQKIKYLYWNSGTHMNVTCGGAYIRSTGGPATLTIKGKDSSGSSSSYYAIAENVSLVVDASNFTQTLAIRTHPTSGSIIVTNGTLTLTDTISFPNATNLHIYAGATLNDNSTVAGSLAGPTNITIEGTGKIKFATTAASPFNARKAVLHVAANSIVEIPSGMTVEVRELWVDGVKQNDGDYTKGGSCAFLTGSGTLTVADYTPTTGIWTGSASDDNISTDSNWKGGTKPNLTGNFLSVAVSNGTQVAMNTDAYFLGLVFDPSITGFTFDGTGKLRIAADGVTIPAGDGTARTWNFAAPLVVKDSATWTFPATDTLNITGGMSGSGSVTFNGGSVNLEGDNENSGSITLAGGSMRVKGKLGSAKDAAIFAQVSASYPVTLDGADVFLSCSFSDGSKALYCTAGSSNCITGKIKNNPIYPNLPADATFVIAGEMYLDAASWTPYSTMKGTNIWVATPYLRGLGTVFKPQSGTTIYAFPTQQSCPAMEWYLTYGTAHSRFDVDNVCKRRKAYVEAKNPKSVGIARSESDSSTCDLNGTEQTFNGCNAALGTIYSESPASLVISPLAQNDYTESKANWVLYPASTFGAQLQGPVSLKFHPSGALNAETEATTLTIAARAYESTGSLEVTNHTMIVASGATFKNLAKVRAVDAGVFELNAADAFGDELTLELGGTAKLTVASGALLRARTVIVNGTEVHVRPGAYTTEGFKAKLGDAFEGEITGDGHIRVTGAGTQVILR